MSEVRQVVEVLMNIYWFLKGGGTYPLGVHIIQVILAELHTGIPV